MLTITPRRVSLNRVELVTALLAAATALLAYATKLADAVGVLAGAVFMLADFHLIRMLVSLLIRPGLGQSGRVVAMLLLTLKLLLALVLVAGVFYQFPIAPVSFAVGASTLLVAVVLDGVFLGEPVEVVAETEPFRDTDS